MCTASEPSDLSDVGKRQSYTSTSVISPTVFMVPRCVLEALEEEAARQAGVRRARREASKHAFGGNS